MDLELAWPTWDTRARISGGSAGTRMQSRQAMPRGGQVSISNLWTRTEDRSEVDWELQEQRKSVFSPNFPNIPCSICMSRRSRSTNSLILAWDPIPARPADHSTE